VTARKEKETRREKKSARLGRRSIAEAPAVFGQSGAQLEEFGDIVSSAKTSFQS